MMVALANWWGGLSRREHILLGVMAALLALVFFVFAIVLPIDDGLTAARERIDRATLTSGQIEARIATLDLAKRSAPPSLAAPLATVVAAAATDAGFVLERANQQGEDRVAIAIPAAKSTALFGWLGDLQARGIFAETITVRRNADASLAVEATLRRRLP